MTDRWTGPHPSAKDRNPYVDWWDLTERDRIGTRLFRDVSLASPSWVEPGLVMNKESLRLALEEFGLKVPIPAQAEGTKLECLPDWYKDPFPADPPPDLPEDMVIVGIIDTGIALGHRHFRRKDGSTRFLAAWQQTSEHKGQKYLPCGQELHAQGIDDLLRRHSHGGRLDEDAFNRAAHLVEPWHLLGHRDLDYRAAHGTHVLDLAAGLDPDRTDAATLDKFRIIAVNLPPQYVHGSAGNFLAFFAVFALERILCLADALWRRVNPGKSGGYPVVVNFSYGMQAGPKDGNLAWEKAIQRIIDRRSHAPTRLVMPVGNDNLERGAAVALMGTGKWTSATGKPFDLRPEISLPWRITPSDQTSNFVELWGTAVGNPAVKPRRDDFRVFVTPPGRSRLQVPTLKPGQHAELGDYARVYCPRGPDVYPLRLVVCVAPTLQYGPGPAAPAGDWDITVQYDKADPVDMAFHVQSDQSGMRHSRTGEQSWLDHPDYRTHRDDTRLRDSHDYDTGLDEEPWDEQGPVQRKGSHNALATGGPITVVGGYRLTDGRPALYSATTNGARWRDKGREVIDGLYPTDDGPAHFGLLGAGSRDGSVAAFRGTSMAAAQATRAIAAQLGTGGDGSPAWLRAQARAFKAPGGGRPAHYHDVHPLKGGPGHLPAPPGLAQGRPPRFENR